MRSWRVLSPLDRLLGSLEALLDPPGALVAASWSLLGASWRGLGASWAPLVPTWRRPKSNKNLVQKKINFQTPKRRIFLSYGTPFWHPKSTKIEPQTGPKLRRFSRAKKLRFKSLLEPSWADLAAFWAPSGGPPNRCGIGRRSV